MGLVASSLYMMFPVQLAGETLTLTPVLLGSLRLPSAPPLLRISKVCFQIMHTSESREGVLPWGLQSTGSLDIYLGVEADRLREGDGNFGCPSCLSSRLRG